jgi:hypothetical protein
LHIFFLVAALLQIEIVKQVVIYGLEILIN